MTSSKVPNRSALSVSGAVLVVLLGALLLTACTSGTGTAPPPDPTGNLMVSYGPSSANVADVYPASVGDGPRPVVLWVHGGGWSVGSRADVPAGVLALQDEGFSIVSIDHRKSPNVRHPEHMVDVKRAITWVVSQAGSRNFDPNNVFVAGWSSGGHLAMLAAFTRGVPGLDRGEPAVRGVVSVSGPTDLVALFGQNSELDLAMRLYMGCDLISFDPCNIGPADPGRYLDAGDPPLLLIHGTADTMVPVSQSRSIAEQAAAVGVDVLLLESPDGHLSIANAVGGAPLVDWLTSHLGPIAPEEEVPHE